MQGLRVSLLFDQLEDSRKLLNISDWGISQSTMEDVFMKIVEISEEN